MKKIIVPTDFSLYSINALRTAAKIAKKTKSEIIVFHALELAKPLKAIPEKYTEEEAMYHYEIAKNKLEEILKNSFLKNIKSSYTIKRYNFFHELNDITNEQNIDLIVIGSHGASGIKELLIGSNTEKIVRTATIPVLVVKGLPSDISFKKAIFATDFTKNNIAPYLKAKEILSKFNCDISLINVNTPTEFNAYKHQYTKAINFLNKTEGNINLLDDIIYISDYSVEEGLLDYASSKNFDLIIIATKGKKGLKHFFEGSISEDISNHSRLPVLNIRIDE